MPEASSYPSLPSLLRRIDAALAERGRDAGRTAAWLFAAWLVAWFITFAAALALLSAGTWWSLALVPALAGIALILSLGFMHEGSHRSIAGPRSLVNRLASHVLSLFGVSPAIWRLQHVINHHTHTNVPGADPDIEGGPFFRFHAGQTYHPWQRLQHLYAPVLYSLLVLQWIWFSDIYDVLSNRYQQDRRTRWRLAVEIVAIRCVHILMWFVLPLALGADPLMLVILYVALWCIVGLVLSLVFQAAHVGSEQIFPSETAGPEDQVAHQLETTADFAPQNRLLTALLGGLNLQVEHHLFPHIHHRHLPIVHRELQSELAERGLRVQVYPSFTAAVAAHFAHLRRLGRPESAAAQA